MTKAMIISILSLLVTSCATSIKTIPNKDLSFKNVFPTELNVQNAYVKTHEYLAKYLKDANHAIKFADKASGKIVAKIGYDCYGVKRPDVFTEPEFTTIDYIANISFKDKKMLIEFESEGFRKDLGQFGIQQRMFPAEVGQKEVIEKCSKELANAFVENLKNNNSDW